MREMTGTAAEHDPGAQSGHPMPTRRGLLVAGLPLVTLLGACGQENNSSCVTPSEVVPETTDEQEQRGMDTSASEGDPQVLSAEPQLSEHGLALSPDGTVIAAGEWWERWAQGLSATRGTTLWDTATGEITARFDNGLTGALAWHPDGDLLACAGARRIDLVDSTGAVQVQLTGHGAGRGTDTEILDLAFSPDGAQLASLSTDGTVRLWAVGAGTCNPGAVLRVRRLRARRLSYSPDGTVLAISGPGRAPELWDPATGQRRSRLTQLAGDAHGIAHVPDGTLLIGTENPTSLQILALDEELTQGPTPLSGAPLNLAVSGPGRLAVGGERDNQVMVWDPATDERWDLPRVPGSMGRLCWSPDGDVLYGVSRRGGVMAWDGGEDWRSFTLP